MGSPAGACPSARRPFSRQGWTSGLDSLVTRSRVGSREALAARARAPIREFSAARSKMAGRDKTPPGKPKDVRVSFRWENEDRECDVPSGTSLREALGRFLPPSPSASSPDSDSEIFLAFSDQSTISVTGDVAIQPLTKETAQELLPNVFTDEMLEKASVVRPQLGRRRQLVPRLHANAAAARSHVATAPTATNASRTTSASSTRARSAVRGSRRSRARRQLALIRLMARRRRLAGPRRTSRESGRRVSGTRNMGSSLISPRSSETYCRASNTCRSADSGRPPASRSDMCRSSGAASGRRTRAIGRR
jgi:hypothetical protein